jgi:uncharacterized protein (DUF2147 family)
MKKVFMLFAACPVLFIGTANATMPLVGFYKTIDDKTNAPRSIIRLYECGDLLCGRIVALYNVDTGEISETIKAPARIAERVRGRPKMVGLDVIWNMTWNDRSSEYTGGRIMDPQSGSTYSSVIWQDRDNADILRVRGRIGPVGRTQSWHRMAESNLPAELRGLDASNWQPVIHR